MPNCWSLKRRTSPWRSATGWCAYTYYGHSESDILANHLYNAAEKHLPGHKIRTYIDTF